MPRREHNREPSPSLAPLVTIGDPTVANLLAARLRSEGVAVWLRGEMSGPYPVGVGGLADVQVFVDADHLALARSVYEDFVSEA
jgi:hypothetical protein